MRDVTEDFAEAIRENKIYPFMLADIEDINGTFHVWSGYGILVYNEIEYLGLASLGSVSNLEEVESLYASGAVLTLNEVPSSLISTALAEIAQGKNATLYLGLFDATEETLISAPSVVFKGLTDIPTITDAGESSKIELTVESELIRLENATYFTYTPHDQKRTYPTDTGFDFVASLAEKSIEFGG